MTMNIKKVRQILKSFADDTRLRIVNLLSKGGLSVNQICEVFGKNQSTISKHLTRLRLTGIVVDKRKGMNVYYYLAKPVGKEYEEILNAVTVGLEDLNIFKQDLEKVKLVKKQEKQFNK